MECLLTNMFKDVLGWVENNQAVQEWKRFASIFVHLVVGFHACKGRGMLWLSWWATRIRRILWLWYPRGKIWKSNICNVWLLHILSCYFHIFHQVTREIGSPCSPGNTGIIDSECFKHGERSNPTWHRRIVW
jgi:hypothetical protein